MQKKNRYKAESKKTKLSYLNIRGKERENYTKKCYIAIKCLSLAYILIVSTFYMILNDNKQQKLFLNQQIILLIVNELLICLISFKRVFNLKRTEFLCFFSRLFLMSVLTYSYSGKFELRSLNHSFIYILNLITILYLYVFIRILNPLTYNFPVYANTRDDFYIANLRNYQNNFIIKFTNYVITVELSIFFCFIYSLIIYRDLIDLHMNYILENMNLEFTRQIKFTTDYISDFL